MTQYKSNLKKCTKCQLPETYETIEFDKDGACNICEGVKYKTEHTTDHGHYYLFL